MGGIEPRGTKAQRWWWDRPREGHPVSWVAHAHTGEDCPVNLNSSTHQFNPAAAMDHATQYISIKSPLRQSGALCNTKMNITLHLS